MKIVIISRCIYPTEAPRPFRATELAKFFASKGHEVLLFASLGKFNYDNFEKNTHITVCSLGHMFFSTLNSDGYVRNNIFDKVAKRLFGRALEFPDIELAWKTKKVIKRLRGVDLLITVAIPHPIHWGVAWAKRKYSKNFPNVWISDCGDPYMGNTVGPKHPSYFQIIEDFWGKMTDYITIPIEEGRKAYSPKVQNKIRVIPQGFDFSNVKLCTPFTAGKTLRFAYAGAIYPGYRDPSKLLDYLVKQKNKDFQFVIYTKTKSFFAYYKKQLNDNLVVKDYIPREQLLFELSQMDFLVNLVNSSSVQAPSKLIDYYVTKRPIIDISSSFDEQIVFEEFMNRVYTHKHKEPDISCYDINNIGEQFLALAQ